MALLMFLVLLMGFCLGYVYGDYVGRRESEEELRKLKKEVAHERKKKM